MQTLLALMLWASNSPFSVFWLIPLLHVTFTMFVNICVDVVFIP